LYGFKLESVFTILIFFRNFHLAPLGPQYGALRRRRYSPLIIGKQTLHDIGAVLDIREKTITIDSILLPTRNIVNLQVKPSVTRALKHSAFQAQEPISTQKATKRVIVILDVKYELLGVRAYP